jgi:GNAT superfamily N-acetyltransferase
VPDLAFRHYDATTARAIRETVGFIYREGYAAAIDRGHPFVSGHAPMRRFDTYLRHPGFGLIIALLGEEPVGQAWGWALEAGTRWWDGLVTAVEPGFTDEDGTRTFALCELMVRQHWTGRGFGHALHDEILRRRRERRATLLVERENATAYQAYLNWGWRKVAESQPEWPGAKLMDVLLRRLDPGPLE